MLISVILSFRNEEDCLKELVARLQKTLQSLPVDYELLFINDASTDHSLGILHAERQKDARIKIINMSRNFGNAQCIMAGFKYSRGDTVVYMDADLQDPPELIREMFIKFQEGYDVVYTTRLSREGESRLKMLATKVAYRVLRFTSKINLPVDSGDFKLLSRRVVDKINQLNEKDPLIKALISWVGFKQAQVFYHREKRFAGITHFPFSSGSGIHAFIMGLTAFSTLPLNAALLLGFILSFASLSYVVVVLVQFFLGHNIPGWTALMTAILLLGSIQLLTLGFMGIYLGRVYAEVKNRPSYIVESAVGFENRSNVPAEEYSHSFVPTG